TIGPDAVQQMVRRATGAHIVLGVDLEEIDTVGARENIVGVFGLEPNPGQKPGEIGCICSHDPSPLRVRTKAGVDRLPPAADYAGRLIAMSEPGPNGVWVVAHWPWSTSFQALPW